MGFRVGAHFCCPMAVLHLSGELDLAADDDVSRAVSEADGRGCSFVTIDLTDVSFIDCAGLGSLVAAKLRLDAASGVLQLRGMGYPAARLLDLTGMTSFFDVAQQSPVPALVG